MAKSPLQYHPKNDKAKAPMDIDINTRQAGHAPRASHHQLEIRICKFV
jgi:hypothetical protein